MLGFPMLTNLKPVDLDKGTVQRLYVHLQRGAWAEPNKGSEGSRAHRTTMSMGSRHLSSLSVYTAAFPRSTLRVFTGLISAPFLKMQNKAVLQRTGHIHPPL